jgi:hypothetical protein
MVPDKIPGREPFFDTPWTFFLLGVATWYG